MPPIARDRAPDSTVLLLRDGYDFVQRRCREHGTDVVETRLLGQPTICMVGAEAAAVFYDTERFERHGAMPLRMRSTLTGFGSVQGLDGEAHAHRKASLMSLMTPERLAALDELVAGGWRERIHAWARRDEVVLFREVAELLCEAVCAWAAVPLPPEQVATRTDDLLRLIDSPARVGPDHWRGMRSRWRAERWGADLVTRVRDGALDAPHGTALQVAAALTGSDGERLSPRVAAVELLNVLRPTVAVNRYVVFTALALHQHPGWRDRLRADDALVRPFVQEVRRTTPFFPFTAARVRRDFTWNGARFPKGRRVLLDLDGTNHDPRTWEDPWSFRPERFVGRDVGPFDLVPQGGGDHLANHRCAGEWLTIALLETAVRMLTHGLSYSVPHQDLRVPRSRMPTAPASGFVIAGVHAAS